MSEPSAVTLVRNAIHNPSEPRHFMTVTPVGGRRVATVAGQVVADSTTALVCKEVGRVAGERHPAAAWSYVELVTDNPLQGLVAFDAAQVSVSAGAA